MFSVCPGRFRQVAKYVNFSLFLTDMHDLRLIHTDLKPENILLVSSEYIKLPGYKVFSLLQLKNMPFSCLGLDLVIIHKENS